LAGIGAKPTLQEVFMLHVRQLRTLGLSALLILSTQVKARADDDSRSIKTVFVISMEKKPQLDAAGQPVFRSDSADFPEPQRPVHQQPSERYRRCQDQWD
jgi:hypothetical protein